MAQVEKFGSILVDPGCSNNCVFCKIKAYNDKKDLTRKEEKQLYLDTKYFIKNKYTKVDISGSEPLKYSKIIPYLRWMTPYFNRVTILDPGNRLADEEFCKKVINSGISTLVLPIYGDNPETHGKCVDNPKAFKKITAGFRNLKKNNKKVGVETTSMILKQNHKNIPKLVSFMQKMKFPLQKITIPHCHNDNKALNYDDFVANFENVKKALLSIKPEYSNIELDHIPPCIFSENEIKKTSFRFFNVYYTYNLSEENEQNEVVKEIVSDYRRQYKTKYCKDCYLFKKGICGGIYKGHYERNLEYEYHPISKSFYLENPERIIYRKVNPK
jgi:MoaA/NifB/PqqE/SkfB family radical SAM enzyme